MDDLAAPPQCGQVPAVIRACCGAFARAARFAALQLNILTILAPLLRA